MRNGLAVVSVIGLLGASGFVAWSVMGRTDEGYITGKAAESFNLKEGPAPAPSRSMAAQEDMRDAVASVPAPSSLMKPIAFDGLAVAGKAAAPTASSAGAASAPSGTGKVYVSPRAEAWARKQGFFARLMSKPAAYMMGKSAPLSTGASLRRFLADPQKVDAYMNSGLVRVALNSPAVAKAVLGNSAVIRAFLGTGAMRDPQAVRELVASPMVKKMLDCPAVTTALSDPGVMQRMLMDPGTVRFIAANPAVMTAISEAVPALGGAVNSRASRASASFGR